MVAKTYFCILLMNSVFKKSIGLLIAILCFSAINAQKIAHLHLDSLINNMSETKTAQEVIDKFRKEMETESINLQTEFETKVGNYQDKEASYSATVKQTKINELQTLQKKLEDFRNEANQKIQAKYNEYTAPIVNKAKMGIAAYAKEKSYNYVLDTSAGNVLYFESSDDVFAEVLKKLEAMPPALLPLKEPVKTASKPASNKATKGK